MATHTQFSVFLVNRPVVLTQVCRALAEAKVNIIALTMMDAMEHGVMRIVSSDVERARDALQQMNFTFTEATVLAVEMSNKPGAAADVCEKLASAKCNISYMYCSTSGAGGKAIGIFKVANMEKARKALESKRKNNRDIKIKKRQPARR